MELSVIVVSFNPPDMLTRCLDGLIDPHPPTPAASLTGRGGEETAAQVEILVVGHALDASVKRRFPKVRWIDAPDELNIPQMRSLGIRNSQGETVALLEDDCLVSERWVQTLLDNPPSAAVGGPVEPGDFRGGLDWAVFYCDYGRFMMPFSGTVDALPGNNAAYQRQAIDEFLSSAEGFYEVFVNQQLQASGQALTADSRLAVHHRHRWTAADATGVPFHHGRGFAALRVAQKPPSSRLIYALASAIIPPLQTIRVAQRVRAKGRSDNHLLSALPWIVLYYSCWAIGEFLGYLFGAGESAAKWR